MDSKLIKVNFGINELLPDAALVTRHINNWLLTFGKPEVSKVMSGIPSKHRGLTIGFNNLVLTYSTETVLNVWHELFQIDKTKKEVTNG